jgi:hypothetical protein
MYSWSLYLYLEFRHKSQPRGHKCTTVFWFHRSNRAYLSPTLYEGSFALHYKDSVRTGLSSSSYPAHAALHYSFAHNILDRFTSYPPILGVFWWSNGSETARHKYMSLWKSCPITQTTIMGTQNGDCTVRLMVTYRTICRRWPRFDMSSKWGTMKGWTKFQIRVSARCCNTGKSRLSKICRLVPFSEVKNIKMYPLFGGQHSEHVVIIYFFRGRDICDTQSKSGNIGLFYVHVTL